MKSILPFKGDDVLEYSITYTETTPESLENGDFSDRGFVVDSSVESLSEILSLANGKYGIYSPTQIGSWESTNPLEDKEYFEKSVSKYFQLHIKNEDGSKLSKEEHDFITALLNNGKYSENEDDDLYEWSDGTNYSLGGWVFGSLIGGFLGYNLGKAVGYGRAHEEFKLGGIMESFLKGKVSKEDYFLIVRNWVYFTFNYPHKFVENAFENEGHLKNHFVSKWHGYNDKQSSSSAVVDFYSNLSDHNREILVKYIQSNYGYSQSDKLAIQKMPTTLVTHVINHWNYFCLNFPYGWLPQVFKQMTNHFESKWKNAHERAGSIGAVNRFFTELDTDNQRLLTDWVYDNYTGYKFEQGGETGTLFDDGLFSENTTYERGGDVKIYEDVYEYEKSAKVGDKIYLTYNTKNPLIKKPDLEVTEIKKDGSILVKNTNSRSKKRYFITADAYDQKVMVFSKGGSNYENGGEIKVGDRVNTYEIKMPNGEIQFEAMQDGEVKSITDYGTYWVLNPKTNKLHQVSKEQIKYVLPFKKGGSTYSNGGGVDWKDIEAGDSARVISENKMGMILKPYGRKFHIKFPDGSEKTYDKSELEFYKFDKKFNSGGETKSVKKDISSNENLKVRVYIGEPVLYKDELWYVSKKPYREDGELGISYSGSGAWGMNPPFIKLSKIDMSKLTDMMGRKVELVDSRKSVFKNGGGVDNSEIENYYRLMEERLGFEKAAERILKDSNFSHYKNTPSNEFKHNSFNKKAIIGKKSVSITSYSPEHNRYIDNFTTDNLFDLVNFIDKNQIYSDGGKVKITSNGAKIASLFEKSNELRKKLLDVGYSKGQLMEFAYGENYRNVDSAIPHGSLERLGIEPMQRYRYVMDYNNNTFGEIVDLYEKISERNPIVKVSNADFEDEGEYPILEAYDKFFKSSGDNYYVNPIGSDKYDNGGSIPSYDDKSPRLKKALELIDKEDDLVYDVASEHGQIFDNIKHTSWFINEVANRLMEDDSTNVKNKIYILTGYSASANEDSYEHGELDFVSSWDENYSKEFKSKESLIEYINKNIIYVDYKESDFDWETGNGKNIQTDVLCSYDDHNGYYPADEKEKALWKKGKKKLYNVHYWIDVQAVVPTTYEGGGEAGETKNVKYAIFSGDKMLSSVYLNDLGYTEKWVGFDDEDADKFGRKKVPAPRKLFVFRENSWLSFDSKEDAIEKIEYWKYEISKDSRYDDKIKASLVKSAENLKKNIYPLNINYRGGGSVDLDVVRAIFDSNQSNGLIQTSRGKKSFEGFVSMIGARDLDSETIAKSIFVMNSSNNKISTDWGDKTLKGLVSMIEGARQEIGLNYSKGGEIEFRELSNSKNFDVITPNGRFEIEVDKKDGSPKYAIKHGDDHRLSWKREELKDYQDEIYNYAMRTYSKGGSLKGIKKKAEKLLEDSITYVWRDTDMGSGWKFSLESPYGGVIENDLLLDYFDIDDLGLDEDWDSLSKEDKKYYYEDWKETLFEVRFEYFKNEMIEQHLEDFIEYIQQAKEYEDEMNEYSKGGGVGQFPPKGELTNKDNFLLKYEKKGGDYEFYIYKPETKKVGSYKQVKHICVNKDCPTKMSYNQFINYLYAESYLDHRKYANGGDVKNMEDDSTNNGDGIGKNTKIVYYRKGNFDQKWFNDVEKYYLDRGFSKVIAEEYAKGGGVDGDWCEEALTELIEETENLGLEVTHDSENNKFCTISDEDAEYYVFIDEDSAREYAVKIVKQDLEENPEYFNQDWLMEQLDSEKTRAFFEGVYDEYNTTYATDIMLEDSDNYANRLIEELVEDGLMDDETANSENAEEEAESLITDFVNLLTENNLSEGNDGYDYYKNNFGQEQAIKLVIKYDLIDVDEASENAVDVDGIAHFIAGYDHIQINLPSGYVAFKVD